MKKKNIALATLKRVLGRSFTIVRTKDRAALVDDETHVLTAEDCDELSKACSDLAMELRYGHLQTSSTGARVPGPGIDPEATSALRKTLSGDTYGLSRTTTSRVDVMRDGQILVLCTGRDGTGMVRAEDVEGAVRLLRDPSTR